MSEFEKKQKLNRKLKYDIWAAEEAKRKNLLLKSIKKEMLKNDPNEIRRNKAMDIAKNIYNDQKELYAEMLVRMDKTAENLENLILHDLGLDENVNKKLTLVELQDVMSYYKNKGLYQLQNSIPQEVLDNFFKNDIHPYSKMFKHLISKRAEFLIFAPKDRMKISAPFNLVKDNEMRMELAKHMNEYDLFKNFRYREKFSTLYELSLNENSKKNMEVENEKNALQEC